MVSDACCNKVLGAWIVTKLANNLMCPQKACQISCCLTWLPVLFDYTPMSSLIGGFILLFIIFGLIWLHVQFDYVAVDYTPSFLTRGVCFLVLCIFSSHYECNDVVLQVAMGGSCTLSSKVLDCLFFFLAEGLGCKVSKLYIYSVFNFIKSGTYYWLFFLFLKQEIEFFFFVFFQIFQILRTFGLAF